MFVSFFVLSFAYVIEPDDLDVYIREEEAYFGNEADVWPRLEVAGGSSSESKTDNYPGLAVGNQTESGTDNYPGLAVGNQTESGTDNHTELAVGNQTESGTDIWTEAGTDNETESGTGNWTESGTGNWTESGTGNWTESGTDQWIESGITNCTEAGTDNVTELENSTYESLTGNTSGLVPDFPITLPVSSGSLPTGTATVNSSSIVNRTEVVTFSPSNVTLTVRSASRTASPTVNGTEVVTFAPSNLTSTVRSPSRTGTPTGVASTRTTVVASSQPPARSSTREPSTGLPPSTPTFVPTPVPVPVICLYQTDPSICGANDKKVGWNDLGDEIQNVTGPSLSLHISESSPNSYPKFSVEKIPSTLHNFEVTSPPGKIGYFGLTVPGRSSRVLGGVINVFEITTNVAITFKAVNVSTAILLNETSRLLDDIHSVNFDGFNLTNSILTASSVTLETKRLITDVNSISRVVITFSEGANITDNDVNGVILGNTSVTFNTSHGSGTVLQKVSSGASVTLTTSSSHVRVSVAETPAILRGFVLALPAETEVYLDNSWSNVSNPQDFVIDNEGDVTLITDDPDLANEITVEKKENLIVNPGKVSFESPSSDEETSGLSGGAIAGIVIAIIVLVVAIIILARCVSSCHSRAEKRGKKDSHLEIALEPI